MKQVFALLFLVCAASAQVTVNIGSVTVPNEVSNAVEAWRLGQTKQATTTLAGNINASVGSGTVADASGIAVNDQIVIDSEALNITAINGNVLTWNRGASITVAASHSSGAVVRVCKFRSAVHLMREMIRAEVNAILSQQPSTTLQARLAEKATADAAIAAFLAASVQE